jgi:cytochrome P450
LGPIVRINPNELHINGPGYYDELYGSTTKKRDKYRPWVALAGAPRSGFATVEHDLHRMQRGALNSFFSKKAVTQLESVVQEKIETLCQRFEGALKTGKVFKADAAYMALTMDVICQYSFAADDDYLLEDDSKIEWKDGVPLRVSKVLRELITLLITRI